MLLFIISNINLSNNTNKHLGTIILDSFHNKSNVHTSINNNKIVQNE